VRRRRRRLVMMLGYRWRWMGLGRRLLRAGRRMAKLLELAGSGSLLTQVRICIGVVNGRIGHIGESILRRRGRRCMRMRMWVRMRLRMRLLRDEVRAQAAGVTPRRWPREALWLGRAMPGVVGYPIRERWRG
jgi:hypothetical protein